MTSIRYRMIFASIVVLTIIGTFGFLTYHSYQRLNEHLDMRDTSYQISTYAFRYEGSLPKDVREHLKSIVPTLQPEFRQTALLQYVDSQTGEKRRYVIKVENDYRAYINEIIAYMQKRILYYGLICLGASFALISGLIYMVLAQVFDPLKDLSSKMIDFLNNRYSYQFTVPAPNEIGKLHATFNAMAQRVLQQIEELQALDKAKSEFLSIASHELRTPLTSIKGSLSLLGSGVVGHFNEAAQNLMNIALNETDRLIRLINELLDLAKIEARRFPLNCEWQNVQKLVKDTTDGLQGLAKTAQVRIEAVDEDFPLEAFMDRDRIQQVLTNLMSNAIKFSPVEGTVRVVVNRTENGLRFEVQDQGKGIAPEDQELIFEKFRQATSADNPLVKGTGLGLAIAKALVEQHGGTIGVHSVPGQGSTFYFTLPKWRPATQKQGAMAS